MMNKLKTILVGFTALLLAGCEFMSYDEYELPVYDGVYNWVEVTKNADWSNRLDHAAVAFDNKLWVLGGYNPGEMKGDTYCEDVWSSADGKNWDLVLERAPWDGRRGHSVIVFDDGSGPAMYLLGGFTVHEATGYRQYSNDVWKSTDGKIWTEIKANNNPFDANGTWGSWIPRMNHSCVVANHGGTDYIYLIGGFTMLNELSGRYATKYFNDVWRSSDGISWDSLPNNDYGIRAEHGAVVNPGTGRIYIQGGSYGVVFEPVLGTSHPITDWESVWSSDDGINWIPEMDASLELNYFLRVDHQLVYYNNTIWSLPGKNSSTVHYHFTYDHNYTIWSIDDDNYWSVDSEGEAFDARHGYPSVVFDNKVWILGGQTNRQGQANDVWYGEIK